MKIFTCAQGSAEWHQLRAGCITASMFADACSVYKAGKQVGQPTVAAKDYAFKVAVERIGGRPLDGGFENWGMRRGHELEPAARLEHEMQLGVIVQRAGFVMSDEGLFGASLDGLIGEDGCSEYKCFAAPEKLRSIIIDGDMGECLAQVQGGLWITGRKWADFCLYCPELEAAGKQFWRKRVTRDDDYIETMEADLMRFAKMVDQYEATLRTAHADATPAD